MRLPATSVDRIVEVFSGAELGDPRRSQRLEQVLTKLACQPDATVPQAMGSEAELEGAYRFMRSDHVSTDALFAAHAEVAASRAVAAREKVLAIHDTTTFVFPHADPEEIGHLNTGKAGFFAHYTLITTASTRRPLGIAHVETIFRDKPPAPASAKGRQLRKRNGPQTARNAERESLRWQRGFQASSERLVGCEVIHVADREGDNYELLARAVERGQRFVVRARLPERRVETGGDACSLAEAVEARRTVLTRKVRLSSRAEKRMPGSKNHAGRIERDATLDVSATTITMQRPRYQAQDLLPSLELNVVRVFEPNPPRGEDPVEWILYTTESIATPEQLAEVVDTYRARWLIEECNKAIKSGCRYESRQFEGRHALLTLLALTLPIACELLWLRACSRESPDRPALDVISPLQLKILATLGHRKLGADATARDVLLAIAGLGGHIKANGDPGWLVLHRGMVRLSAYEEGWLAALSAASDDGTGVPISR